MIRDIRQEIQDFVALGPLPSEQGQSDETIAMFEHALLKIAAPVTRAEAMMLTRSFGPDNCFGMAWSLLHLIESAPGGLAIPSTADNNEWIQLLRARYSRKRT